MFEKLEEALNLCDAKNFDLSKGFTKEQYENLNDYISYCENKLNYVLEELKKFEDNNSLSLKDFEDKIQEKILYLMDDISSEMYLIQNFLPEIKNLDKEYYENLNMNIDGVEALLLMIPEEVEKTKCVKLAFLN